MALIKQEDLSELESNIKDTKENISDSSTNLEALSSDIQQRTLEINDFKETLEKLAVDIPALEKDIAAAQSTISANKDKIASNEALLKQYDGELAAAESAGDDAEVKRLLELIADLNIENKALITENDQKTQEVLDKTTLLKDSKDKQEELGIELETHEKYLADDLAKYNDIKGKLKSLQAELEELESSPLLKEYEEQVKTRKEHAKGTIKNKERIKVLLRDQNATVEDKLNEFDSDSEIFIKDIKAELEFTEAAENKLERVQGELDEQGVMFTANEAFKLSSQSVYDIKEVVEKIKKACYEGKTSIDLTESEVLGTQILMLNKAGYKITHSTVSNPGRKQDDLVVTIDWGFAPVY